MEKILKFKKGEECYEVTTVVKNKIQEILIKDFEDVDATLKSDISITIKIDLHKNLENK